MNDYLKFIGFLNSTNTKSGFKTPVFGKIGKNDKKFVQLLDSNEKVDDVEEIFSTEIEFHELTRFKQTQVFEMKKGLEPVYCILNNDEMFFGRRLNLINRVNKDKIDSEFTPKLKIEYAFFSNNKRGFIESIFLINNELLKLHYTKEAENIGLIIESETVKIISCKSQKEYYSSSNTGMMSLFNEVEKKKQLNKFGVLNFLDSIYGKETVKITSDLTNVPIIKVEVLLIMAYPVLTKALIRINSSNIKDSYNLLNLLKNKKQDDIFALFENLTSKRNNDILEEEGEQIMIYILGEKRENIELILGKKSNISKQLVRESLKISTPILIGYIRYQIKIKNIRNKNDLNIMLNDILVNNSVIKKQKFFKSILGTDTDGSVIDDVAGMVLGANKKKSGSDGSLDGLFGKRGV